MPKIRHEYHMRAVDSVRRDLHELQVSERVAARLIGVSRSTLNSFLNLHHTRPRHCTIDKILGAAFWGDDTKRHLLALRDYEALLVSGEIRSVA